MELVIDIDKSIYNLISNSDAYVLSKVDRILIEIAIANGTPLPEHGRLIDADERRTEIDIEDRWVVDLASTILESKPENWKQRWIER